MTTKPSRRRTGLIIGEGLVALLGGITYLALRDTSPYGKKSTFPNTLYGKQVPFEKIPDGIKNQYLAGKISDAVMNEIVEGRIKISDRPLNLSPEDEKRLKEKGYLIK